MKLMTTAAVINKAIDSIERRGKKLDQDIQQAGLSCLNHNQEHGDITLLNRLYLAMPKGSRRNALIEWALKYGKCKLNEDKSTAKDAPLLFNREGSTDLAGANEEPWFNCKPEKDPLEEFDFVAAYNALLRKATKAGDSGKKIKGQELLDKVKAVGGVPSK